MAVKIDKAPIVALTAHAIVCYPNGKGYAVKHTYCADMDGDMNLLRNTLANILEQRFPHTSKISFVSPETYDKAVADGTYGGISIEKKDGVNLPSTILFKSCV